MKDLFLDLPNVEKVRARFQWLFANNKFVIDKTGVKTVEIINGVFIADESVIFGTEDQSYIKRELEWYKSMSLSVNDIPPPIPEIWKRVADKNGLIHSNYGWCIFSKDNHSQYDSCLAALKNDIDTRRATMIYTRPSIQQEYNRDGMSDFICTNNVHFFIRNDQLISSVFMRSNDAVFGYKNDWSWHKHIQEQLLNDLKGTYSNLVLGPIIWNSGSIHVYERHFKFLEKETK